MLRIANADIHGFRIANSKELGFQEFPTIKKQVPQLVRGSQTSVLHLS